MHTEQRCEGGGEKKRKNEEKGKKSREYIYIYIYITHKSNIGRHGKQHSECETRRMNSTSNQRRALPDAGRTIPTGQRPGSNNSVRKLMLLIFKAGIYWSGKHTAIERLPWLSKNLMSKLQGCVLLKLELWPLCSKNQLQNSNSNSNKTCLNVNAHYI